MGNTIEVMYLKFQNIPPIEFFTNIYIILDNFIYIDLIYPGVGSNLDFINKYSMKKQININCIYREEDLNYWKDATSGFYKFKTSFYSKISS